MLHYILLFLCISVLILWFRNRNSDYWKKRNVIPANNVLWNFIFENRSLAELFKRVYDKYPTEPHVGIFLGSNPNLLLRDLENIQAVLAGDFQSFHSRGFDLSKDDLLGDNVLFINDFHRWKILRQKLSPCFTSMKLKNLFYIMERCARDFVEVIRDDPKMVKQPFHALYTYTTASIGASIFGIDTKMKNTMDSPFLDMAWRAVAPSLKATIGFVIFNMCPSIVKLLDIKAFSEFEDFFIGVVKNVLTSRRNDKEKRHDFIDICLELQSQGVMKDLTTGYELEPTDTLLAAQAFFFFIAGADTSGNTMHFALLELSNNPEVLQRLHDEIDEVFTSCDEKVTYDDIEKLTYLDMVINEAMRKYPPIGLVQRKCTRNTTLPVGNVKMEKDDVVVIPIYAIHRDENYYPNPELFDPERFAPDNISKLKKFSYLPFGEGNRICLGMRFARLQVKAGLAWLLRRYTLREQSYNPERFEPSAFSLRLSDAHYDLLPRRT